MAPPPIPQNDPKEAYLAQREAKIDAAIAGVLAGGWYILGHRTAAFEAEFAAVGRLPRYGVGVGSGTDALIVALRALGIGRGKTVVTVSHTAGGDGDGDRAGRRDAASRRHRPRDLYHGADAARPGAGSGKRRRPGLSPIAAVVPVHLYGQPADLDAIAAP